RRVAGPLAGRWQRIVLPGTRRTSHCRSNHARFKWPNRTRHVSAAVPDTHRSSRSRWFPSAVRSFCRRADVLHEQHHRRDDQPADHGTPALAAMTPERWRQVTRIYGAVLTKAPDVRAAALVELCPDDEALRKEVESLLAVDSGALLDRPVGEVASS